MAILEEKSTQFIRGPEKVSETSHDAIQNQWTPTRHELLVMISLSLISLMVSLDATVIVTSLQVRFANTSIRIQAD